MRILFYVQNFPLNIYIRKYIYTHMHIYEAVCALVRVTEMLPKIVTIIPEQLMILHLSNNKEQA